jgi:hypothetical protein
MSECLVFSRVHGNDAELLFRIDHSGYLRNMGLHQPIGSLSHIQLSLQLHDLVPCRGVFILFIVVGDGQLNKGFRERNKRLSLRDFSQWLPSSYFGFFGLGRLFGLNLLKSHDRLSNLSRTLIIIEGKKKVLFGGGSFLSFLGRLTYSLLFFLLGFCSLLRLLWFLGSLGSSSWLSSCLLSVVCLWDLSLHPRLSALAKILFFSLNIFLRSSSSPGMK